MVLERKDVVVIGGGAAGLMCAMEAGRRGRKVLVLEHAPRLGNKILISGGGRCNFTNRHARAENYLSRHPDFCKSALSRYTPGDFTALVQKHGIAFHEKKQGQLFCDRSSRDILDALVAECQASRVEIRLGCGVHKISKSDRFQVATSRGTVECASMVIATGGLSFPKLGATDFGHRIARDFGLGVTEIRPGLVPLEFRDPKGFDELSGISFEAVVRCGRQSFRENVLLTHRGLSGPAILQISSYWREGIPIELDLLPDQPFEELVSGQSGSQVSTLLSMKLPKRFAQRWCDVYGFKKPPAMCSKAELTAISKAVHAWTIMPSGTEGYARAEVTLGGVDPADLSSKTMETRKVPGLYFVGEVVDVTGWLGGFNFQWAWASGHAAGRCV